jgi:hypothetical protein
VNGTVQAACAILDVVRGHIMVCLRQIGHSYEYSIAHLCQENIDDNATPAIHVGWGLEATAGIKLWGRIEATVKLPSQPPNSPSFAKENIDFCWTQFVSTFSKKNTARFLGTRSIPAYLV